MKCSEVAKRATDYSEGALAPWSRWGTRRHLAACSHCRTYVEQLASTGRALSQLAAGTLEPGQQALAMQGFRAWQRPPAARDYPAYVGVAALMVAVTAIGLARSHTPLPPGSAWLETGAALVLGCGLVLLAGKGGLAAAALSALSAVGLALLAGSESRPLALGQAVCSLHEVVQSALAVSAVVVLGRKRWLSRANVVGVAAAAAFTADAALHVSCKDAASLSHGLVFHVGGVLIAAALAAFAAGRVFSVSRING